MGKGLMCLMYPEVLGLGPGHTSTQFTDLPQMCALCRQALLSFTPTQSGERLQLAKHSLSGHR